MMGWVWILVRVSEDVPGCTCRLQDGNLEWTGVFEFDQFAQGTEAIARTPADLKQGATIIGGGDP